MGPHLAEPRGRARLRARAARPRRRRRVGADRGEDRRRRVHDPGDQRRHDGDVPAVHLRLPVSATTATRVPGTGGMGSLSMAEPTLPFMTAGHYEQACSIIERVIERLAQQGRHFSGVMNSGFFATADGVKVIEFNARFGDPECMNIMSLFDGSWPEVMERIASGSLTCGGRPPARGGLGRAVPGLARLRAGRPPAGPVRRRLRVRARARADRSGRLPRVLLLGCRDRARAPTAPSAPRVRSRSRAPRPRSSRHARASPSAPPRCRCSSGAGTSATGATSRACAASLQAMRRATRPRTRPAEEHLLRRCSSPTPAEGFVQGWRDARRARHAIRSSCRTPTSSPTARVGRRSSSTPAARSRR